MITPTTTTTTAPDATDAAAWLEIRVKAYQAECDRLETELKRQKILLRGHQIYLEEVRKKGGR